MNLSRIVRLVPALALAGSLSAQATAFDGAPGGVGDVLVFPSPGAVAGRPAELQGIRLLAADATGRSAFSQFLPEQPRLKEDIPGCSRLLLPQNAGCLYRYSKATPSGADFGFFVVRPDGMPQFLVAFPGSGPLGLDDPTPNPVAITWAGDTMLVATTRAAGGDLFEVDLVSGATIALTDGVPPLETLPQGLAITDDWGAALTPHGPYRFARGGGQPVPLRLHKNVRLLGGSAPFRFFGDGIAVSADGSSMAIIAGASASQAHVYTFGAAGSSVRVSSTPSNIAAPAFGTIAGPTLAISADGRRVAWKTTGASGECFTRAVPTLPTPPAVQVTADANFTDTLNDTGVISFFGPDELVMLVGEVNGAAGIERGDFFCADFSGGNISLSNLTQTSGETSAPFLLKGELETTDGLYQLPGGKGIVSFVPASSDEGTIQRSNLETGTVEIIGGDIEAIHFVEAAGPNLVFGLLHELPGEREMLRIPFDPALPVRSLGSFPRSTIFGPMAGDSAGFIAGNVNPSGGELLGQVFVPNGAGAVTTSLRQYGPVLGFDGTNSVLTSLDTSTQTLFIGWALSRQTVVYGSAPQGFVLPAN